MPPVSVFYGIIIRIFFNEHAPPHFHVQYGENKAEVAIQTFEILEGFLPNRVRALVMEWAAAHRAELMEDWDLCRQHRQPNAIQPLE